MTTRNNRDYIRVLLYSYIYYYYRVEGPPNESHIETAGFTVFRAFRVLR